MFALMTNKAVYRDYLRRLQQLYNPNEAAVITGLVFEKIAGLQRGDIIRNPEHAINADVSDQLNNCLQELLRHKPVQYVLGEAWFYKLKLIVDEQVLIPRPETEELVQLVVEDWSAFGSNTGLPLQDEDKNMPLLSMIDIGTGSGCIAIALKKNLTNTIMYAIDISAGALSIAKENAANQQAKINFLNLDFLEKKDREMLPVFDAIISNPPYIPLSEKEKLAKNVTAYEPPAALFVKDDAPLIFYEKIAGFGKEHLRRNGKIYVEVHEDFAEATARVFKPFYSVAIKKDIFGKDRILVATFILP